MAELNATLSSGWTLALRSIRIEMREHALGYAWTLITPILYAVFYIFIKRELSGDASHKGVEAGWDVLRAFTGVALLQCWMQVIQGMTNLIRRHRGMLCGLDVGPLPFVLAIMFEGMIALAIRVVLIVAAIPVLGLPFPLDFLSWLWFVVSLLVLHLSASAIGLILAPWATLYKDVNKALQSINLPLILISPIFYAATQSKDSMLYWLNMVNPLASPLAVLADALQSKTWSLYSMPLLVLGVLSATLLLWSLVQLRRQVPILLERMGN